MLDRGSRTLAVGRRRGDAGRGAAAVQLGGGNIVAAAQLEERKRVEVGRHLLEGSIGTERLEDFLQDEAEEDYVRSAL